MITMIETVLRHGTVDGNNNDSTEISDDTKKGW